MENRLLAFIPSIILWCGIITSINPNVFPVKVPANYIITFLGFFLLILHIFIKGKIPKLNFIILLLTFTFLPSVIYSAYSDVALVKLIMFFICMQGLIYLVKISTEKYITKEKGKKIFILNLHFILFLSLVIYLLGLGYTVNDTGLSGVLVHPQSFGLFLSLITVYLFTYFQSIKKYWYNLFILSVCLAFLYATESRAAMISSLIAVTFFIFNSKVDSGTYSSILKKISVLVIIGTLALTFGEQVMSKGGRSTGSNAIESLENSRLRFAISSFENFKEQPLYGIGFQVSNGKGAHYPMEIERGLFDIPIKASIEKGSFPPALFEEVGFVGALGFIGVLFYLFFSTNSPITRTLIIVVLLMSLGEATLFSLGGVGLFNWLFLFFVYLSEYNDEP